MLPKGWHFKRFGEVAEFRNGLNFPASARGTGLKLVGVGDFKDHFTIRTSELEEISGFDDISDEYLLKDGDLLFVRSNGNRELIGRVLYMDGLSESVSHSGFTIRARVDGDESLRLFLAHFFHGGLAREQFLRLGGGTNISNLSQDILACVEVPVPPEEERSPIINAIQAWSLGCKQLDDLILAKCKLKLGLTQKLLTGKRRFAEFADEPWEEFHLGDLFDERNESKRSDLPLLSITADRGVINRDEIDRKDSSNADKSKYKRIVPGDIGYNTMRMWQGVSALSSLEGIVSPAYTICKPKDEIDADFAKHLFKFPPVIHLFYRYSQGLTSDTWNLKYHHFSQIKVRVPKAQEQRRIAEVLDAVDAEILLLKNQQKAVEQQKKGLMQQLLTGKVRVPTKGDPVEVPS